jgi:phospholipase C
MLGGDTFGITDDDAYYCKRGSEEDGCSSSESDDYVDHTITAPNLTDQLRAKGLSWKGYFEDIPAPGSPVYRYPSPSQRVRGKPNSLYAVKHNGFMNFKSVQDDPLRAHKIVGFDQLAADIAQGTLPNFAMIVPNQCNDMHGLVGRNVPWDCFYLNRGGLIARADARVGDLVTRIIASPVWRAKGNAAIVITFDENDSGSSGDHPESCCGSPHNPGGGWITTIVITNHGPRGVVDATAYNHYSLLRTIEMAFGIATYLGHAADRDKGVVAMTPLFAVGK